MLPFFVNNPLPVFHISEQPVEDLDITMYRDVNVFGISPLSQIWLKVKHVLLQMMQVALELPRYLTILVKDMDLKLSHISAHFLIGACSLLLFLHRQDRVTL